MISGSAISALFLSALIYAASPATSVVDAAMTGNKDQVKALLKDGADVNTATGDGMTALHYAVVKHDVDLAKMLLYAGANVKATTRIGGYTPLLIAARDGDAPLIDTLLGAGADPNSTTTNGTTALMFAAASGRVDAVKALIAKGANVNVAEPQKGETALTFAAANGRADVIRELTAHGADVKVRTKVQDLGEFAKEEILFQIAQRGGQQGGNNQQPAAGRGGRGAEPPAAAATNAAAAPKPEDKKPADAKAEEKKPAAAPAQATAASTSSGQAGRGGRGRGADPLKQVPGLERQYNYTELVGHWGGMSPLHLAARQGQFEAVQALIDAGADINQPSAGDRVTPMLIAIINGNYDIAKYLLDKGADPNLAQDNGVTPLYAALNCQWSDKALYPQPRAQEQQKISYLQLMEALLQKAAIVNARLTKKVWYSQYDFDQSGVDETGATPFWRAAYADDIDAMKLLVKWGADPTIPTLRTPGRVRTGDAVREAEDVSGLPPVPVGGPGVAPLLAAAGAGYGEGLAANHHHYAPTGMLAAVKYMIEELHVDPTVRDHEGNNAIHDAAARGDVEMIKYLVSKGVDPKLVNREGKTTADMANGPVQRINPWPDALALLESLGAKNNHKCVSC
ncbi:MAG TPA: ankyrin repeat domain-containing protein [Vicinamibacterales bacterium]|nr:ankyrin repeat domain-containing protein [Vicinamibacterales bacterium]